MMEEPTTPARAKTQRSGPARISTVHEKIQVASGDLKAASRPAGPPYVKSIETLEIAQIQPFRAIPDFKTLTTSPHPIVQRTPSKGYFCLDGPDLIEKARQLNCPSIVCEIIHARTDSEVETALIKAALRSMPPGGRCSYPEQIGNTVRLFKMLIESREELKVFSHGGARRGTGFTNCREHDAVAVLEERLGRQRKTILKILEHGAYLDEMTLAAMVEADVSKGFFEAMQQGKQNLISGLKVAQRPPAEIVEAVSARMLKWLKEARTPAPVEIGAPENPQTVQTTKEKASRSSSTSGTCRFVPWAGNEPAVSEPPIEEVYVRTKIKMVGTELVRLSEASDLAETAQIQVIRNLTVRLSKLTSYLIHLSIPDRAAKDVR